MPLPDKLQTLHLYRADFRQPFKLKGFAPRNISVLGGSYLVWGISTDDAYQIWIYVLNESEQRTGSPKAALGIAGTSTTQSQTIGVSLIVFAIVGVIGLGLGIILFRDLKEVIGAGGLGITFTLALGLTGFFIFKKLT